jgi:orotate phosphoribosyltransferase
MSNTQEKRVATIVARHLWESGCIIIKSKPSFRWASGIHSPIYADNRLLLSHPRQRNAVAAAFLDLIKTQRLSCDVVAGVATSGIPMAAILADRLKKPLVYVRPQPKAHGRGRQIEGRFKKGARVILIEDLLSTGGSSLAAAEALCKEGARVTHLLTTFAYLPELVSVGTGLKSTPTIINLTDADTLLKVGLRRKFIGPAKEKAARRFLDQLAQKLG